MKDMSERSVLLQWTDNAMNEENESRIPFKGCRRLLTKQQAKTVGFALVCGFSPAQL
jgi:hypothetical protein